MEINESSFSPQWNQDFSIDYNFPKNEKRRRHNYFPSARHMRYALNVFNKFDGGNDTWLVMKNYFGEWVVVYHGTSVNLKDIIGKSLNSSTQSIFGKCFYCSLNAK
jgi:hypothetical protein